jgi:hypothetical protein
LNYFGCDVSYKAARYQNKNALMSSNMYRTINIITKYKVRKETKFKSLKSDSNYHILPRKPEFREARQLVKCKKLKYIYKKF